MATEIKCANLDNLRQQIAEQGAVLLDKNNPPTLAKRVIANALGPVKLVEVTRREKSGLIVPSVNTEAHQVFMREAQEEAKKSPCWVDGVGTIVVDNQGKIVARGHNHPVIGGRSCKDLAIDVVSVRDLLEPGERLNFCQAIHDVTSIIAEAARDGRRLSGLDWYLSLEPCDNCANSLVMVEPRAVYFSLGVGRERYYNSVGLERLLAANIPTFFVEMSDNQNEQ